MIYSAIKQNQGLYGSVLLLSLFLITVATGAGLFGSQGTWGSWQHKAFEMLCHQDPARSFWINGTPMAVCARCYGIYTAFGLLWGMMPIFSIVHEKVSGFTGKIILGAILLNIVDVVGNLFGFWQNTLLSRFLMGSSIGIAAVLLLAAEFLITKNGVKQDSYGFNRTI